MGCGLIWDIDSGPLVVALRPVSGPGRAIRSASRTRRLFDRLASLRPCKGLCGLVGNRWEMGNIFGESKTGEDGIWGMERNIFMGIKNGEYFLERRNIFGRYIYIYIRGG